MQVAFLSVFPEHLSMADRQGVYGRQYLLEGSLKGRIHLVQRQLGGERLSGLNCR